MGRNEVVTALVTIFLFRLHQRSGDRFDTRGAYYYFCHNFVFFMVLDITGKRPVRSQILRSTYPCFRLFLFDPLVLFYRFRLDGGSGLVSSGVRLLNVSTGSGDSAPSLATTDTGSKSSHE